MPYKDLGFVNRKTTKSGNDILQGKIKVPEGLKAGDEFKIMINMSRPTKNNGYSVAQLIDDPNYKSGDAGSETKSDAKSSVAKGDKKTLF